ncbi:UDP-glucose--hexose-1-phosphate uridylyltransferase [Alkalicoccus chagannorensis]|uniref:UDP-glucose--hexose-1-phosphate uridylyltransferase n=1 Tax=Alkalicoccus chagannorensis TaxID=427072 RepID=UPI0003F8D17E|nr:UDP-glucose--hexose-1-phosphate uridylyltransferase [Alkalicoccus chagannorensis]
MIDRYLNELTAYARGKQLISAEDDIYCKNQLLDVLGLAESLELPGAPSGRSAASILEDILDWAAAEGIIGGTTTERDLLDTKLMSVFAERPSNTISRFREVQEKQGIEAATAWFYEWNQDIHYIRRDRIAKNETWKTATSYGDLDMTINLSKPEKDPKEIEAAKANAGPSYPLCLLCRENVGYAGRLDHPARQNLRTIPVQLNEEGWQLQFSPYVYYHEHAIVLKNTHDPMKITEASFQRLVDFVHDYPHYFIGSNADLPIVGGSILSHDHYQAGRYEFPMARAAEEGTHSLRAFPDVTAARLVWPMSVLRLRSQRKQPLVQAAAHVLAEWKQFSAPDVDVYAETDGTPHHTITPIARRRGDAYELDLVLRNNRTSEQHPAGIFHPHEHVHHIKKENIGLIEVMGLAVLPGRLKRELEMTAEALISGSLEVLEGTEAEKHAPWAGRILEQHPGLHADNVMEILREETGQVFHDILHHAGVFKRNDEGKAAFQQFVETL